VIENSSKFTCAVCGWAFGSAEELDTHKEGGSFEPKTVAVTLNCEKCGKKFRDMRALTQHSNFCQS
jgi:C4-type Zn-finger protein